MPHQSPQVQSRHLSRYCCPRAWPAHPAALRGVAASFRLGHRPGQVLSQHSVAALHATRVLPQHRQELLRQCTGYTRCQVDASQGRRVASCRCVMVMEGRVSRASREVVIVEGFVVVVSRRGWPVPQHGVLPHVVRFVPRVAWAHAVHV